MRRKESTRTGLIVAVSVVAGLGIFIWDLSMPLGVAGGIPYVALVLISLQAPWRYYAAFLAAISTVLVVLGYFFSPSLGILWVVITNRFLAVFAIWVTAAFCLWRKRAEEKLATSLREKEVLLREVHHRVKNNMQAITSLLKMQSMRIDNRQALHAFSEARNRIQAMALVHETMHQSEDLSRIRLRDYVEKLANALSHSVGGGAVSPTVTVVSDDVELNINQAIPVGLIINELLSNSLQHAFVEGRQGEIRVTTCLRADEELELAVSDNGVGLPEEIDVDGGDTLGLQLVGSLARDQLGGRIEIARNGGTTFMITFRRKAVKNGD